MPKFTMHKYYEGEFPIDTDDILTAVKHALNYEADLYCNGSLIMSPLGLSREENTKQLEKYGIKTVLKNHTYCYEYIDSSKNTGEVFAQFYQYYWDGVLKLDVRIHDYAEPGIYTEKFKNVDEVIEAVKKNFIESGKIERDNVYISAYIDGELKHYEDKLFPSCDECNMKESCICHDCISMKKTSKGCKCQAVMGCYKEK
jgi:hypothetical protein